MSQGLVCPHPLYPPQSFENKTGAARIFHRSPNGHPRHSTTFCQRHNGIPSHTGFAGTCPRFGSDDVGSVRALWRCPHAQATFLRAFPAASVDRSPSGTFGNGSPMRSHSNRVEIRADS